VILFLGSLNFIDLLDIPYDSLNMGSVGIFQAEVTLDIFDGIIKLFLGNEIVRSIS